MRCKGRCRKLSELYEDRADEEYYRLYDKEEVRKLVDALSRLLGDKYITGFFTY